MYEEIEEHFKKEYPKEGCGVIAVVKGKKSYCYNIRSRDEKSVCLSNF